jgi:hypothetical protein
MTPPTAQMPNVARYIMDDNLLKFIGASITALFAAIVAILLYVLKKKDDELSLIKNKISDEKYKTYFSIVSLFFDILKQDKGLATFGDGELAAKYIDIKKNLLLLGSDDIIKKFSEFDKGITSDDLHAMHKIKTWLDLFILIRKDSGNPKTKLTIDDILRSLIKEADYVDVKELINKVDNLERKKKSKRQSTDN